MEGDHTPALGEAGSVGWDQGLKRPVVNRLGEGLGAGREGGGGEVGR